jgi:transposase-like protein
MGRKTTYSKDKHVERAVVLAREGRTDKELAASLGIAESTLYDWMNRHPEFAEAIKEAKEKPNREVEAALFKRAIGYDVTEGVVITDRKTGKQKTIRATKRHVPGDVTAMIFYLKNRRPELWKDVRHQTHGGSVRLGGTDLSRLTDKQLDELEDLLTAAEGDDGAPGTH